MAKLEAAYIISCLAKYYVLDREKGKTAVLSIHQLFFLALLVCQVSFGTSDVNRNK
jgi:hypothetical protein